MTPIRAQRKAFGAAISRSPTQVRQLPDVSEQLKPTAPPKPHPTRAYTLVEMLACLLVIVVCSVLVAKAGWTIYARSSLANSASNIRSLSAGAAQYLADNDHRYWKFRQDGHTTIDSDGNTLRGTLYWFGFETVQSSARGEGNRDFDPTRGPLADYVPAGSRPDPSFILTGANAFKPKYRSGYIGVGYNGVLGGGFSRKKLPLTYWQLSDPSKVVVFATCAQINTFQAPASSENPMLEDFYLIDERERTVHFRHGGAAMVGFANGSAGLLPMDESTLDNRLPEAKIGRFAPVGSKKFLE